MDNEYILKTFESIGIPKMQTLVYLDLLKNRESSATDVSKRTKMHRANVYDTLTKLKERNLVYLSTKDGRQVFAALPSELIVSEEKDRLENLKLAMEYIKTIYLPGTAPKIYTLDGVNAVKSILFGVLEKEADIVWIYGLAENKHMLDLMKGKLMNSFHIERIKKQIKMKFLFNQLPTGGIKEFTKLKLVETKLLPRNQQTDDSQITQIVCGNSVYITLWLDPICTIVIENDLIAREYSDLYELLWEHSKEII
jgi:sugar-specific transcriptional regulator TrmB